MNEIVTLTVTVYLQRWLRETSNLVVNDKEEVVLSQQHDHIVGFRKLLDTAQSLFGLHNYSLFKVFFQFCTVQYCTVRRIRYASYGIYVCTI